MRTLEVRARRAGKNVLKLKQLREGMLVQVGSDMAEIVTINPMRQDPIVVVMPDKSVRWLRPDQVVMILRRP